MNRTEAERLVALETSTAMHHEAVMGALDEIKADIKAIRTEVEADKAELAALKNKGAGILIGVGLAGGGIGAAAVKLLEMLK